MLFRSVTLYYVIKIGSKIVKEGSIDIVVLKSEPLLKYYNAVAGLLGNELFLGLRSVITTGRTNTSYDQAKEILQNIFPNHEVIGICCSPLIKEHGSLHCVTMQFPKGVIA